MAAAEDVVPSATLTFESPEVYLKAMRAVAKLTDAVGKSRKGLPTTQGDGFLVVQNGVARINGVTLTVSSDPRAAAGVVDLIVKCGPPRPAQVPPPARKAVSAATAASQTFQSAAVRAALADGMGVQVMQKSAAELCSEANARAGNGAKKPRKFPKTVSSDTNTRYTKMRVVAQVLGLVWRKTKDELQRAAPSGKSAKKAFVEKGLASLAAKLVNDPGAIMKVPAVCEVYKKVTGTEPTNEVKRGCACCGAKGCASCKVVMLNAVHPHSLHQEAANDEVAVQPEGEEAEEEEDDEILSTEPDDENPASAKRSASDGCADQPSPKNARSVSNEACDE